MTTAHPAPRMTAGVGDESALDRDQPRAHTRARDAQAEWRWRC